MPCPGGGGIHAGIINGARDNWNGMSDAAQCAAVIGAVIAASFVVAGLAAQLETAGGATVAGAILLLRYGRAIASYMRAIGAAITAGCAMFLSDI